MSAQDVLSNLLFYLYFLLLISLRHLHCALEWPVTNLMTIGVTCRIGLVIYGFWGW